jgi:uncharacterized membrane protein YecN with MAPEG domain
MTLPITALVAVTCGIMLLATSIDVVIQRERSHALFGDAGNDRLRRAIRANANLAEHAPVPIILIGLLEFAGADPFGLSTIAALFASGRLANLVGLYRSRADGKPPVGRVIGIFATWAAVLVLCLWLGWMIVRTML